MEIRFACHPEDFRSYGTSRIREQFLIDNLLIPGRIKFVYSHYDRILVGGAAPSNKDIELHSYEHLKSDFFLERREMGVINVGGKGFVFADGQTIELNHKECLYLGRGTRSVTFRSAEAGDPARFFLVSAPAHTVYPLRKFTMDETEPTELGSAESSSERTVYPFIHEKGIPSCQLIMGMTILKPGSVWNTMPTHTHDRRMGVYFYFDLPENQRVTHLMGEPSETRHIMVSNEQAIISPSWSIHSGAGTHSYSLIWAMAGENNRYTDMNPVDAEILK
jgi:4-deoxy-L-threo-5-hexosulose-uronate ketol-isomerase